MKKTTSQIKSTFVDSVDLKVIITFGAIIKEEYIVNYVAKYLDKNVKNIRQVKNALKKHHLLVDVVYDNSVLLSHNSRLIITRSQGEGIIENNITSPSLIDYYNLLKILNNLPLDLALDDGRKEYEDYLEEYKDIIKTGFSGITIKITPSPGGYIFPAPVYCYTTRDISRNE